MKKTFIKYIGPVLALLILVTFFACTKVFNEVESIIIQGKVTLEGVTDYSNINVALYHPAALDTAIVNMHKRFPSVGFELTQAAVFDHREASPVFTTKTDKDGAYLFDNVPDGVYNVVASKNGYGWRYIYNVDAKTEPADIRLQPEIVVEGILQQYTVWDAYQHVIVKGDVIVPEDGQLIIDKGVVVRVDGYYGIEVKGQLTTNGVSSEMIKFTNELTQNVLWNGIIFDNINYEIKINNCFFEKAVTGLKVKNSNVLVTNCYFFSNNFGCQISNESTLQLFNSFFVDCNICTDIEFESNGSIERNFYFNSNIMNSIGINNRNSDFNLYSNIIYGFDIGILMVDNSKGNITNNLLQFCNYGFKIGSGYSYIECDVIKNTIQYCNELSFLISYASYPKIQNNNILQDVNKFFILAESPAKGDFKNIIAQNNFWGGLAESEINRKIIDKRVDKENKKGDWEILINPIMNSFIKDAFPE